jgi:hypothetical protein
MPREIQQYECIKTILDIPSGSTLTRVDLIGPEGYHYAYTDPEGVPFNKAIDPSAIEDNTEFFIPYIDNRSIYSVIVTGTGKNDSDIIIRIGAANFTLVEFKKAYELYTTPLNENLDLELLDLSTVSFNLLDKVVFKDFSISMSFQELSDIIKDAETYKKQ